MSSVCGWHCLSTSALYVAGIIYLLVHCMWLALSVCMSTVCGWHYLSTSQLYVAGIMCLQVHCMWLALCVYKSTVCGWHYVSTSPLYVAGIMCLQVHCVWLVLSVSSVCPDASVVHSSGSGQLQANPHVAVRGFPLGSPPEGR